MKRKGILFLLVMFFCVGFMGQPVFAKKAIEIQVNGKTIQSDVAPFIHNDRTYVPVRFVSEALGAKVEYRGGEKDDIGIEPVVVIKQKSGREIIIRGRGVYSSDGVYYIPGEEKEETSSLPYINRKDRIFLPIRLIGNAYHMNVGWNQEKYRVSLDENKEETVYSIFVSNESAEKEKLKKLPNYHMQWKGGQYIVKETRKTFQDHFNENVDQKDGSLKENLTEFGKVTYGGNYCGLAIYREHFSIWPAE